MSICDVQFLVKYLRLRVCQKHFESTVKISYRRIHMDMYNVFSLDIVQHCSFTHLCAFALFYRRTLCAKTFLQLGGTIHDHLCNNLCRAALGNQNSTFQSWTNCITTDFFIISKSSPRCTGCKSVKEDFFPLLAKFTVMSYKNLSFHFILKDIYWLYDPADPFTKILLFMAHNIHSYLEVLHVSILSIPNWYYTGA